ncbi:acyloxyacyl hydrolase [Maribacter sp. 1_MG-2023]|uniref:acyloxyacyl hydrolase n=1 Tax=Maribacter sp. 1_MG-2023 TaxID=3062677 RepID=UPI0026E2688C|nr:acyloxyacyl hydrolase [Maribacter sp. 1_MG-2023]MDO6473738.1 acyloxyacyl hydrolase [Maribacter sp. 1_MG-2023]
MNLLFQTSNMLILIKYLKSIFSYKDYYSIWMIILLFGIVQLSFGQRNSISFDSINSKENFGRFKYIELKGHSGMHIYTGGGLTDEIDSGYSSFDLRFGWQPSNEESWTNPYGFSSYGVGWYSGFVGDPKVFGKPNALFGFINFPLSKYSKRNVMEISPALGLTYNLEPFDAENNPLNDAIGARMAVYFSLHYGGTYRINREMDLIYGIDFTHFSNGRTYQPNYGLNMFGFNLGFRYHYNADQHLVNNDPYTSELLQSRFKRPKSRSRVKNFDKANSFSFHAAIGTVQNDEDAGTSNRYNTFSGVMDYRHKFDEMHGLTTGLDLFYDGSLKGGNTGETSNNYSYGIHVGYDLMFWRMALRVQMGTTLGSENGKNSNFIRPGLQYNINDWLHTQVALKTKNGAVADWVEFGIGITPFKW